MDDLKILFLGIFALLGVLVIGGAVEQTATPEPRLIGLDCVGENGRPVYADEEDQFPTECGVIRPLRKGEYS